MVHRLSRKMSAARATPMGMKLRQFFELLCPHSGDADSNYAMIVLASFFAHQPTACGSLHQAHDGVVALLKKLGHLRDRRGPVLGKARQAQQQLVLLRRHAARPRGAFAEPKETAELVAKQRQLAQGRSPYRMIHDLFAHAAIISRCDVLDHAREQSLQAIRVRRTRRTR